MINNIKTLFQNNFILLTQITIFTAVIFPMCFLNNDWMNVIFGEHIDSGSIFSSIIQLTDKSGAHTFYNQNIPFHTLYGYPYNSLIFAVVYILENIFKQDLTQNFFVFATSTRLLNLIIAILIIKEIYWIGNIFFRSFLSKTLLLVLVSFFGPFVHYSYHIKPDLFGLLFITLSIKYLYLYTKTPKKLENIITANVFGGLAILCKQPHIFIIIPLFFVYIFSYKGSILRNIKNISLTYIKSLIIFLGIFFIIHPYAFIDTHAFIIKQGTLLKMTATSMTDNISYWIPTYLHNPTLLIFIIAPLIFFVFQFIDINKKNNQILFWLSIYVSAYLTWLTLKVGPMRFDAYLLPIYPFSLILFFYIYEYYFHKLFEIKKFTLKYVFYVSIVLSFSILTFKAINTAIQDSLKYINIAYSYKSSSTYLSVIQFNSTNQITDKKNKNIIYSASLPVSDTLFKRSSNGWQFTDDEGIKNYNPDLMFIDFTVYWEKPYNEWKKIAQDLKLDKEMIFLSNIQKEKNIVLFYKL